MASTHPDGPWIDTTPPDGVERTAHILELQSLHPAGQEGHRAYYKTIMFGSSPLSRVEREAIAVVVSAANDCFY